MMSQDVEVFVGRMMLASEACGGKKQKNFTPLDIYKMLRALSPYMPRSWDRITLEDCVQYMRDRGLGE